MKVGKLELIPTRIPGPDNLNDAADFNVSNVLALLKQFQAYRPSAAHRPRHASGNRVGLGAVIKNCVSVDLEFKIPFAFL
jgi:hypothetical protein